MACSLYLEHEFVEFVCSHSLPFSCFLTTWLHLLANLKMTGSKCAQILSKFEWKYKRGFNNRLILATCPECSVGNLWLNVPAGTFMVCYFRPTLQSCLEKGRKEGGAQWSSQSIIWRHWYNYVGKKMIPFFHLLFAECACSPAASCSSAFSSFYRPLPCSL